MGDSKPIDLGTLPQIPPSDVRLLWVNDWYEGPNEAVVEHGGKRCLLVLHDRRVLGEQAPPYRWLLYPLDAERFADEEKWHALFVHHVGDHWCFHPETTHAAQTGERVPSIFQSAVEARPAIDRSRETPLGWVDQFPTS